MVTIVMWIMITCIFAATATADDDDDSDGSNNCFHVQCVLCTSLLVLVQCLFGIIVINYLHHRHCRLHQLNTFVVIFYTCRLVTHLVTHLLTHLVPIECCL